MATAVLLLAACASTHVAPGYYRVESGDTLYRIARQHDQSVSDLIRWNKLSNANRISTGQVLRVTPPAGAATATRTPSRKSQATHGAKASAPIKGDHRPLHGISLAWPAQGKLVRGFNASSSHGMHIVNKAGTPVMAAAAGTVAYASNGLRGYGNLVIVRHTGGFLTIYAHNSRMLVKQGQHVAQGQKIAEMGNTDSKQVELYFELRQSGKPVDPARALPAR